MFEYNISNEADEEIFNAQCRALENNIPNLIKSELLIDIDESKIQKYQLNNKSIVVHNDMYIGAVYIKSEIELLKYFNKTKYQQN